MNTHHSRTSRSLLALTALTVFALAGCGDSLTPGEDFDALLTGDAAAGVYDAIEGNAAVQSMAVMGEHFPTFAAAPVAATLPTAPWNPGDWSSQRLSAMQALPFEPTVAEVLFPANYLGTKWVYDPAQEQYVLAGDHTGAPEDGVRIMLYAVDPILHQIVEPLTEVGYVDLIDESTPSSDAVRISATIGSTNVLNYVASATVTTSTITFSADGFVSDGSTQVNFELSVTLTQETEQATIDYLIYQVDGSASVHLVVNADGAAGTMTVDLTVEHGDHTVVFHVTGNELGVAGTVHHNGVLVVEISGGGDNPTFEDGNGNPLTGDQLRALAEMFESVFEFLDSFDNLLGPAFLVLQIPAYAL
jgi:hypothetical protein